jgi:polysaccharide export outer membrane protein
MKKILTIFLLIFSSLIFSQEIDKSFLDSLPSQLKEDIENKANNQNDVEVPSYRSIKSQTELEKKSLEDLKNRLEEDLKYLKDKLSETEPSEDKNSLPLFGNDFFSTYQSTFMPINEPNLSGTYILDFGDILEIQLVGQKSFIKSFPIRRDGSINLTDIGKIQIAGLTLSEASSLIKAKISSVFFGTESYVTLNNIRDVNVIVSGNAYNPGVYTVSGNSSILHAIAVAGGINDLGSYRKINLIRNQKVIETLDIYDVLITGIYNPKISLRNGDIIFVEPVNKIVSIYGAVKRPAQYELIDNQKLSDLINYANGITVDADLKNIFLNRIFDDRVDSLPIVSLKQFDDIESKDGDKIFIRKHSFRSVDVEGAVLKPGRYLMAEGESLNDLIKKSGGFTQNAYPFGAVYENQSALLVNKMASDKLYAEFIDNIISLSQQNPSSNSIDLATIIEITQNLKDNMPNGRIVIDLANSSYGENLIIKNGDRLVVPERPDHVYIYGEVSYEGALKYFPNNTFIDYVDKSGGFKKTADRKAVFILHPNGDTQRVLVKKSLFENSPSENINIYPGSVIFIPRAIDDSVSRRLATQAYVSILGNLGIALASLSTINNN